MKLAEALILRADLKKRIAQLQNRMNAFALVQEGDEPAENSLELLTEAENLTDQFTRLVCQINETNIRTKVSAGATLMEAIAERDEKKWKHQLVTGLLEAARIKIDRYSKTEIKYQSTVDIKSLRKKADDLAKNIRELDTAIQSTNWSTDLYTG